MFVPGRKQEPALQIQVCRYLKQRIDSLLFLAKSGNSPEVGGVLRIAPNGKFIVHDANRNPPASEASDNRQTVEVPANYQRPDRFAWCAARRQIGVSQTVLRGR